MQLRQLALQSGWCRRQQQQQQHSSIPLLPHHVGLPQGLCPLLALPQPASFVCKASRGTTSISTRPDAVEAEVQQAEQRNSPGPDSGNLTSSNGNSGGRSSSSSGSSSSNSAAASQQGGVYIHVPTPSSLSTSRAAHWALLQDLVPRKDWKTTAVVLACLESIYRAEYLQYGQEALAALQAANAACVPANPLTARTSHRGSGPAQDTATRQAATERAPQDERNVRQEPLSNGELRPGAQLSQPAAGGMDSSRYSHGSHNGSHRSRDISATSTSSSSSSSSSSGRSLDTLSGSSRSGSGAAGNAAAPEVLQASEPLQVLEPESLQEAAARLDAELAALLALLIQRAHFDPLTLRDVEVGKALNRDWLLQLFIKGDVRRCDPSLVQAVRGATRAMKAVVAASAASADPDSASAMTAGSSVSSAASSPAGSPGLQATPGGGSNGGAGVSQQQKALEDVTSELVLLQSTGPGSFEWAQPLPVQAEDPSRSSEAAALGPNSSSSKMTTAAAASISSPEQRQLQQQQTQQGVQQQLQGAQSLSNGTMAERQPQNSCVQGESGQPQQSLYMPDRQVQPPASPSSSLPPGAGSNISARADTPVGSSMNSLGSYDDTDDYPHGGSPMPDLQRRLAAAVKQFLGWELFGSVGAPGEELGKSAQEGQPWGSDLLPPESEGLLLFKRDYGEVETTGRLLVQKLDYLQTLLVSLVLDSLRGSAAAAASGVLDSLSAALSRLAALQGRPASRAGKPAAGHDHASAPSVSSAAGTGEPLGVDQPASSDSEAAQEEPGLPASRPADSLAAMATAAAAAQDAAEAVAEAAAEAVSAAVAAAAEVTGQGLGAQQADAQMQGQLEEGQGQAAPRTTAGKGDASAHGRQQLVTEQHQQRASEAHGSQGSQNLRAPTASSQQSSNSSSSSSSSSAAAGSRRRRRRAPLRSGWLVRAASQGVASLSLTWGAKLLAAGRSAARWFSERGVGPRMDVMSLKAIDQAFPVVEPARLPPLFLRKVALAEVFGPHPFSQRVGELMGLLVQPVKLQQPTLREFVVVYRKLPHHARRVRVLAALQRLGHTLGVLQEPADQAPQPRPAIHIRVYRELPLPTWQLALPDKLLQFRPLDLLRADLFALTGLVALLAQARYESLLLDVLTVVSASVFLVRIALGFKRMDDRYRNQVAEVLREKTIASEGPALEYLAAAAGLQQFKQASLAYIYALQKQAAQEQQEQHAQQPEASPSQLAASSGQAGGGTSDAQSDMGPVPGQGARANMGRDVVAVAARTGVGMLPSTPRPSSSSPSVDPLSRVEANVSQDSLQPADVAAPSPTGVEMDELATAVELLLRTTCGQQVRFDAVEAVAELERLGLAVTTTHTTPAGGGEAVTTTETMPAGDGEPQVVRSYQVVDTKCAMRLVQQHWDGLLWQRVDGILREFE